VVCLVFEHPLKLILKGFLTVRIEVYSDEIGGLADLPADPGASGPEAGSSKVFSFI
jgi:hypothetical protein